MNVNTASGLLTFLHALSAGIQSCGYGARESPSKCGRWSQCCLLPSPSWWWPCIWDQGVNLAPLLIQETYNGAPEIWNWLHLVKRPNFLLHVIRLNLSDDQQCLSLQGPSGHWTFTFLGYSFFEAWDSFSLD